MDIKFESKDRIFDDLTFSWYVSSQLNDYRITLTFCGAIDESGNENIYSSINCCISIYEVSANKPYIMQLLKEKIENKLSIELEEDNDLIYDTFPDWRDSIFYIDYDSFDYSMEILKTFVESLASTLEIDADIDNIVDYVA